MLAASSLAVGASFTSVVVIVTVDVFESLDPSLALNVKLSLPLKSGSGWYDRLAPVPVNCPWAGGVTIVNVNEALGIGLTAVSVIDFDVSSAVVTAWPSVPGGLLPFVPASIAFSTASGTLAKKS